MARLRLVSSASSCNTSAKPRQASSVNRGGPVVSGAAGPGASRSWVPSRATHSTSPPASVQEAQAFATDGQGGRRSDPRWCCRATLRIPRRAGGRVPASISRRASPSGKPRAELASPRTQCARSRRGACPRSCPSGALRRRRWFHRIGTVAIEARAARHRPQGDAAACRRSGGATGGRVGPQAEASSRLENGMMAGHPVRGGPLPSGPYFGGTPNRSFGVIRQDTRAWTNRQISRSEPLDHDLIKDPLDHDVVESSTTSRLDSLPGPVLPARCPDSLADHRNPGEFTPLPGPIA